MKIDINCDVGEGVENEHLLMQFISSCNIACGGHFGDKNSIDSSINLAIDNNVLIGAHPSFPDKENFGRKIIDISNEDLKKSIQNQIDLFLERLSKFNQKLHHIKPHGALYNLISVDEKSAILFINTIKKYMSDVFLYVPFNSEIEKVALKNKIEIKYEAFADRNYNEDLTLVSRSNEKALIFNPKNVLNHVCEMALKGKVKTISNIDKPIKVDTFCIHGDNKHSLEILKTLSKELLKKGIKIG
ncbi:5-oxoprolinase subunit PxpA [Polaribacter sp. Z022]|uniref:5-oxoprolinase subunit PxpA n=1 Tax=Polaribacter sp. Z022 TaxID=2927125 RepID=UPI00202209DA|nr:5-oxoprolinase subunit PxpA [Polaribacter sp. Z022]MCL7754542.1 5-oxoprolinase subunit PxpA [Polaribacter sp. Z022]